MIATTRTLHAPESARRPWVWPLPKVDGFAPSILTGGSSSELGYDGGTPGLRFVPVLAAQDGVIVYAGKLTSTADGKTSIRYSMCLDHAGGWSTRYGDLEHMFAMPVDRFARRRKPRVRAGDVLGYARRSPLGVRFELWRMSDDHGVPIEAGEHMPSWLVLPWTDQPTTHEQPVAA